MWGICYSVTMECGYVLSLFIVVCIVRTGNAVIGNPCWHTRTFDIVPGDTCFSYIFCYYDYPVSGGWCYRGTAFDPQSRLCTTRAYDTCGEVLYGESTSIAATRFSCPAEVAEAFYPDYSQGCPTSTYYRCRYGIAETLSCRTGLYYNDGTDQCDRVTNILCGTTVNCPQSLVYGVFGDHSQGCPPIRYYRCYGNHRAEPIKFTYFCPEGLYYNEGIKNCDFRRNIPCSINKKS